MSRKDEQNREVLSTIVLAILIMLWLAVLGFGLTYLFTVLGV